MTEKTALELPLVLPGIPDEQDACVGCLIGMLEAKGLEKAHLSREDGIAHLCLHYDPQRFSVSRVRELAQAAGARIAKRFRHENLRIDGMDCPTCATVIEHALSRTDGILEVSVNYAAERLRLEYDGDRIRREAILRRIMALGYGVLEEGQEAGWFAEHRELIFSGLSGFLLFAGWLGGTGGHAACAVARPDAQRLGGRRAAPLPLQPGHALEHLAMDRARRAIEALAELAPKTALVQRDGAEFEVRSMICCAATG